jgi:hypothetical protein
LEALILSMQNCNLRRIDIRDWDSSVAEDYRITKLPTLWLYKGEKRIGTERRQVLKQLSKLE